MRRLFTDVWQRREPSPPSSIFPESQHWARHARTRTETHTLQYSAEGSGTSRRQHPVPAEWLLCHKGQFGFSLAQLPAWDLNASLTDLWPQVFVFCFGNVSPFFPPSLPHSLSFSLSLKWSAEGVLGTWLAALLTTHPLSTISTPHPLPCLKDGPSELALISPLSDTQAGHSLTCTHFTYTQWHMKHTLTGRHADMQMHRRTHRADKGRD